MAIAAPIIEPTCSGCGAGVEEHEEGHCAFCRMADRGDNQLLTHDSRGWVDRVERATRRRSGTRQSSTASPVPAVAE